jgi:hypothetical protein
LHLLESQLLKAFLGPRETFVTAHRAPLIPASHELRLAVGINPVESLRSLSGRELGIGFGVLSLLDFVKLVVSPIARQFKGCDGDVALVSVAPSL